MHTVKLPLKSCLPGALDGAFPTFPSTCYKDEEGASASHRLETKAFKPFFLLPEAERESTLKDLKGQWRKEKVWKEET